MIKVYSFRKYEIGSDEMQASRRMATREAIVRVGGEIVEGSALEVDPGVLGREVDGMTERDFGPHSLRPPGFQRSII